MYVYTCTYIILHYDLADARSGGELSGGSFEIISSPDKIRMHIHNTYSYILRLLHIVLE